MINWLDIKSFLIDIEIITIILCDNVDHKIYSSESKQTIVLNNDMALYLCLLNKMCPNDFSLYIDCRLNM